MFMTGGNDKRGSARVTQSAGSYTQQTNKGGITITKSGTGILTAAFSPNMPNANYTVQATLNETGTLTITTNTHTVSGFTVDIRNSSTGTNLDSGFSVDVFY